MADSVAPVKHDWTRAEIKEVLDTLREMGPDDFKRLPIPREILKMFPDLPQAGESRTDVNQYLANFFKPKRVNEYAIIDGRTEYPDAKFPEFKEKTEYPSFDTTIKIIQDGVQVAGPVDKEEEMPALTSTENDADNLITHS